ncbi:MAG: class I SAM-dependent rRNA methyltransferase [Candidatus Krumholzibacteriota bacterium]|nr:class I SAM-dependent rRNA methyltransferase [Candidatus Krumholzibacteriota bacterium]
MMSKAELPRVTLRPREDRRLRRGHCWVYDGEIAEAPDGLAAGDSVLVADAEGRLVGSALWNPGSRIRARLFSRDAEDYRAALPELLARARALRQGVYDEPHYRLLYGESDGTPGVTADRYGGLVVAQLASAVAEAHASELAEALLALPGVGSLVLRRDAPVREREGLALLPPEARGPVPEAPEAREGGLRCRFDPLGGMKSGWFWDQRESRAWLRRLAAGRRVLDLFCHAGGFALQAAAGGAAAVLGLDRSEEALALARESARLGGLDCRFRALDLFGGGGAPGWPHGRWDLVVLDPPALAKSRGDARQALGAYEHLNKKAAARVEAGGVLLSCSCTYPVEETVWQGTVLRALARAGRQARVIYRGGQGPDHPVLPGMPETRYLKVLGVQLL